MLPLRRREHEEDSWLQHRSWRRVPYSSQNQDNSRGAGGRDHQAPRSLPPDPQPPSPLPCCRGKRRQATKQKTELILRRVSGIGWAESARPTRARRSSTAVGWAESALRPTQGRLSPSSPRGPRAPHLDAHRPLQGRGRRSPHSVKSTRLNSKATSSTTRPQRQPRRCTPWPARPYAPRGVISQAVH